MSSQIFVDDNKLRTLLEFIEQLNKAIVANKKFDELTGQMLSEKSVAWGTSNRARKAVIGIAPKGTSIAYNFRSLGYFVCTSRKIGKSLANQRCARAFATMQQIKYMPNPLHEKLIFAELCSFTKLTYGSEICIPSERNLYTLRTATINALWKSHRASREPNMVFI